MSDPDKSRSDPHTGSCNTAPVGPVWGIFKPKILEMGGSQLSVLSYCKILHATISVLSFMIIWVVTWGFLFRFQRVESEPTLVVLKQALVILYVICGPVIKGTK